MNILVKVKWIIKVKINKTDQIAYSIKKKMKDQLENKI